MSKQCALAAPRSAKDSEDGPTFDSKGDVFHEPPRAPTDAQIVDRDVRLWQRHVQMPMSAKKNVNTALITITEKMDCTTAAVVRLPTAAAPPRVANPWPHAINPIASARKGVLI